MECEVVGGWDFDFESCGDEVDGVWLDGVGVVGGGGGGFLAGGGVDDGDWAGEAAGEVESCAEEGGVGWGGEVVVGESFDCDPVCHVCVSL